MIQIFPYDKELIKDFKYNGVEKEFTGTQIAPLVEFYEKIGSVYVGILDGQVLGIGGVYPLWGDHGGCFLFVNKEVKDHKREAVKIIADYVDVLIKRYKLKNISVECISELESAHRLIGYLGFKKDKEVKITYYKREGD